MIVAGMIFLFFFTQGSKEIHIQDTALTVILIIALTVIPGLTSYLLGRRAIRHISDDRHRRIR